MEIIIYFITLIICFFVLYIFAKNDFVLIRQNISLSQTFDAAAVSLISAFLFARVMYVVNFFKTDLLNFLRFFHLIKYPGLSFFGFIAGGFLCLYLIFMKKKGIGRIMDIFAISFTPLFLVTILLTQIKNLFYLPILFFIFGIIFFIFFIESHQKYIMKDGNVAVFFLILVCLQTLFSQYITASHNSIFLNLSFLAVLSIAAIPFLIIGFFIITLKKNK